MNQDWHLARHGTSKWKKYARKYALSSESPRFRWTSTITQKPVVCTLSVQMLFSLLHFAHCVQAKVKRWIPSFAPEGLLARLAGC